MRKTLPGTAIAALLSSIIVSTGTAQDQPKHDGFWWGFGLGGGVQGLQWDFDSANDAWEFDWDGRRGGSAHFRVGGTVNPQVLLGAEVLVLWREDQPGQDLGRVNAMATALIYPESEGGVFFKGGFGVATVEDLGQDETGVGTTLGAGYDFRIASNLYLTPNFHVLVQIFDQHTSSALLFTLGLTWH